MNSTPSVKDTTRSTASIIGEVLARVFRQAPTLVLFVVGTIAAAIYAAATSPYTTTIILSLIVGFLSFQIYRKTDNYAESFLTFVLGILAIYSISWTQVLAIIFATTFALFTVLFFLRSSVKVAATIEWNLSQAHNFVTVQEPAVTQKDLQKIVTQSTGFGQLSPAERSYSIRYFAFLGVSIKDMPLALHAVEGFKSLLNLTLEESLRLFRVMRNILIYSEQRSLENRDLDALFQCACRANLLPDEILVILDEWQGTLIENKIGLSKALERIAMLTQRGYVLRSLKDYDLH